MGSMPSLTGLMPGSTAGVVDGLDALLDGWLSMRSMPWTMAGCRWAWFPVRWLVVDRLDALIEGWLSMDSNEASIDGCLVCRWARGHGSTAILSMGSKPRSTARLSMGSRPRSTAQDCRWVRCPDRRLVVDRLDALIGGWFVDGLDRGHGLTAKLSMG